MKKILIYIYFILNFFLILVNLGLADEESDYFTLLIFDFIFLVLCLSFFKKLSNKINHFEKFIYSIIPTLILITSFNSMFEPLRLEGGSLKNTLIFLSIIAIFQFIKIRIIFSKI